MVTTSYAHDSIRRRMDTAWQDAWDFGSFSFLLVSFVPSSLRKLPISKLRPQIGGHFFCFSLLGHSWCGMRNGSMMKDLATLAHEHVLILIMHLSPKQQDL